MKHRYLSQPWFRFGAVTAGLSLTVVLLFLSLQSGPSGAAWGPVYHKQTAYEWLGRNLHNGLDPTSDQIAAFNAMGEEGVAYLVKVLCAKPSRFESFKIELWSKFSRIIGASKESRRKQLFRHPQLRKMAALRLLADLDLSPVSRIPEILDHVAIYLKRPEDFSSDYPYGLYTMLKQTGKDLTPYAGSLFEILTHPENQVDNASFYYLFTQTGIPNPAVREHLIQRFLKDPNTSQMEILEKLEVQDTRVLDQLLSLLTDDTLDLNRSNSILGTVYYPDRDLLRAVSNYLNKMQLYEDRHLEALKTGLQWADETVRNHLKQILGRLGQDPPDPLK